MTKRLTIETRSRSTTTGNIVTRMTDAIESPFHFFFFIFEFPFRMVFGARRTGRRNDKATIQQVRLGSFIERINRLIAVAHAEGLTDDFLYELDRLADRREEIERAIVVWIDLIDVLVQDAECRYGYSKGKGTIKASEVKETILFLLRKQCIRFPHVPDVLVPLVMETVVDCAVEALVLVLNRNKMWIDTTPEPVKLSARLTLFLRFAWKRFYKFVMVVGDPVFNLIARIHDAMRIKINVSPELQDALDAVAREGMFKNPDQLARSAFGVMEFIGTHRHSLVAFVEVISEGVQEAETFSWLTGREKKEYARDLIWAVLNELGFKQRSGLMFMIVDVAISSAIEAWVHLFNKHHTFAHLRRAA